MEKEVRSFKIERSQSRDVTGYAATYADYDMGSFIERIEPACFDNLEKHDVRALLNHDANHLLARSKFGKGTLKLKADERGLRFDFSLPDTSIGNDTVIKLERGDIDQCSWAFYIQDEEWRNLEAEKPLRIIRSVSRIDDISLVTYPANPNTSAALRSLEQAKKETITIKEPIKMAEETTAAATTAAAPVEETRAANFVDSSVIARGISKNEARDFAKFNPMKVIRELTTQGRLTGFEAELNQEGITEAKRYSGGEKEGLAFHVPVGLQKQARAQLADSTANLGGNLITPDFKNFVNFLWPDTPTMKLCSVYDNLEGDVIFPVEAGVPTLGWGTEVAASSAQNATFNQVTSAPTRAHMTMEMSRRVLLQEHSSGLQGRLVNQLNNAYNTGLETVILTGTGASSQPTGIMTALNASAQVVGVPTFKKIVDLFELVLASANSLKGNLAYVTDPATLAFLKTTVLDAGSGRFLAEGKLNETLMANGYPVHTTTTMPLFTAKHGMIFGNFADCAINLWGGPVLMVNPYTKMKESLIEIYMERQLDVKVLRNDSFAISKDIVYA